MFFLIIGFYEVFKKKSFKQRLCLAYNTLCVLVYTSVHLTWSHSNISQNKKKRKQKKENKKNLTFTF